MDTLKTYLKDRKETQAEFARRVGMNQGSISKLCGEGPTISMEAAIRIEQATNGAVRVESWPQFAALIGRHLASSNRVAS